MFYQILVTKNLKYRNINKIIKPQIVRKFKNHRALSLNALTLFTVLTARSCSLVSTFSQNIHPLYSTFWCSPIPCIEKQLQSYCERRTVSLFFWILPKDHLCLKSQGSEIQIQPLISQPPSVFHCYPSTERSNETSSHTPQVFSFLPTSVEILNAFLELSDIISDTNPAT